jgi:hypothetical protein
LKTQERRENGEWRMENVSRKIGVGVEGPSMNGERERPLILHSLFSLLLIRISFLMHIK